MRRNVMILVILCCLSLFYTAIYGNQIAVELPITLTKARESEIKGTVISADIPSITYTLLSDNTFQVSYLKWGNVPSVVIIEIIEFDGEYKIDSIRVEK